MDEEATWEHLPAHEHQFVWDEAEGKFWRDFNAKQEAQHSEAEKRYQLALTEVKVELGTLDGKRNELNKVRERLALELSQVDKELARVVTECDGKTDRILAMERDYRHDEQDWLHQREKVTETMIRWFHDKREVAARTRAGFAGAGAGAGSGAGEDRAAEKAGDAAAAGDKSSGRGAADGEATEMEGVEYWNEPPPQSLPAMVTRQGAAKTPIAPLAPSYSSSKGVMQEPAEALVDLVDADGRVIGSINKTEPWNQWVKAVLGLPIKRPVKIRRGRKFTAEHLAGIYENTEPKGVKWLSCMIQAIGEVQGRRCVSCDKNQGAFDDCIIVGGPLFQKCGNCEWNRQGCHGAALRRNRGPGEPPPAEGEASTEGPAQEEAPEEMSDGEGETAAEVVVVAASEEDADDLQDTRDVPLQDTERDVPFSEEVREPAREPATERERERERKRERESGEAVPYRGAEQGREPTHQLRIRKQQAAQEVLAEAAGFAQRAILSSAPTAADAVDADAPTRPLQSDEVKAAIPERRGLPTSRPAIFQTQRLSAPKERPPEPRAYAFSTGFTPANGPSRASSQDLSTPTPRSIEPSPQPSDIADQPDLPRITRETLVLRHNGREYTYPEIIEGVPLEKIDPSHPYWDPQWPDIRGLIEPPLNQWREKHQQAMQSKDKGEDKASARFQLGRQVNRGLKILEFLDEGDISPYQLLSKKYTTSGKGSITSYDTLFRLCETLSELGRYGLDMHPLEWMRQRLHELWLEQGAAFNVSRIIHNFYNDPKLALLRAKSGFKNIGRPSGVKATRRGGQEGLGAGAGAGGRVVGGIGGRGATLSDATPLSHQMKKRKGTHSPSGSSTDLTSEGGNDSAMPAPESPANACRGPVSKRARTLSPSIRPYRTLVDDAADFTDTDLWSGAPVTQNDFRIDQIKSRLYTSSPRATQYLRWAKERRCLQHQILREGCPVRWGVLREPIDFDVRLDDLVDVLWNRRALKAHLIMAERCSLLSPMDGRPRGDVSVSFVRERTLKRMIRVFASMGVRTIEGSLEEVEHRWAVMQSQQLSERDEELSGQELKRPASSSKLPVAY
ncbi:hypothetical protein Trco_008471 [Trichoderma cornu-damae]|uniref:Uncharacterized protein n=1 Tax=Trichoderma cornu-damae TaxID=654480 RepID=A0A9P8TRF2_9HYPO|nr:hypothetical protein Trco_008471 [Trichoderma cornu-damae]